MEKSRLLSCALLRVCEFLIGPENTRKVANLEIFLPVPHPRGLRSRLRDSRTGRPCATPLQMRTEQKELEVLVPKKMPLAGEMSHREISQYRAKNSPTSLPERSILSMPFTQGDHHQQPVRIAQRDSINQRKPTKEEAQLRPVKTGRLFSQPFLLLVPKHRSWTLVRESNVNLST